MKLLLEPAGNTLSHLGRALAVREALATRGHEVVLAASAVWGGFLRGLGIAHEVLPDLHEVDRAAAPGFAWFRAPRFEACVRAELALLERIRPDRVVGVFRFTGAVSARLAGVRYDALACGSVTPACEETLGFASGEPGEREQAEALRFFRRAMAARLGPAFARLGVPAPDDVWALVQGERTFLWDVPEFQPLRAAPGLVHVGPVEWTGWPLAPDARARLSALRDPLAVVSFGTSPGHRRAAERMVEALSRFGLSVAVAAGGQGAAGWPPDSPRFAAFEYLPVSAALERAALLTCHGGQGVVLQALRHRVPVLVLPFQPEQDQNGRCLERLGCGLRLARAPVVGSGAPSAEERFLSRALADVERDADGLLAAPGLAARLEAAGRAVDRGRGAAALAEALERRS